MATVRGQCRSEPATQLEKLVWVSWAEEWGILQHRETTFVQPLPPPWLRQTEGEPRGQARARANRCTGLLRLRPPPYPCPTLGWYLPWTVPC